MTPSSYVAPVGVDKFSWQIPEQFNFAVDVVDAWAEKNDGPCLIWENESGETRRYAYSDMSRLTKKFASVLRSAGVGRGDRVLIVMPRIPEWQIVVVACLRIGAVPIPGIEMLTKRDVAYRMSNSGAVAFICRAAKIDTYKWVANAAKVRVAVGGGSDGWIDFEESLTAAPELNDPAAIDAEDPVIMYYTSGSTGHPKGVLHAARALYAWRMSARYWLDLRPGEIIWCTADTGWSKAGTSILFGPWSEGACSFFYDGPFEPAKRLQLMEKHGITIFCASATELNRIINENADGYTVTTLRRTVSAGEAMNPVVAQKWIDATGVDVAEAYGQTESLMLCLNTVGMEVKLGSMGKPAPGCTVGIVDHGGHPVADGEEGTIALRVPNPQLMLGYWQDPARTAECFVGTDGVKWYLTGDRGVRDADGYLWYRGRLDDVISSAGYRIGPMEIENALLEHASILECAVVGVPDAERGERVKAFVVLKAGFDESESLVRDLQEYVKNLTAPYKYPREIEFRDSLPKTITGKILRRVLRQVEDQQTEGSNS